MIRAKGNAYNIKETKIFRIIDDNFSSMWKKYGIAIEIPNKEIRFCKNVLTHNNYMTKNKRGVASLSIEFLNKLHTGDIISLDSKGNVVVVWQSEHEDNLLYLTDFCNSHCIMCPQSSEEENRNFYELRK